MCLHYSVSRCFCVQREESGRCRCHTVGVRPLWPSCGMKDLFVTFTPTPHWILSGLRSNTHTKERSLCKLHLYFFCECVHLGLRKWSPTVWDRTLRRRGSQRERPLWRVKINVRRDTEQTGIKYIIWKVSLNHLIKKYLERHTAISSTDFMACSLIFPTVKNNNLQLNLFNLVI